MRDVPLRILENVSFNCFPYSFRIQVEIIQSPSKTENDDGTDLVHLRQTYAATSSGQRFFDQTGRRSDLNAKTRRLTFFSDGKKCANVTYDENDPSSQTGVLISRTFGNEASFGFMDVPPPVRYYHVGLIPLIEALPKAERMTSGEVIGRTCDVFHFKSAGSVEHPQSLVYFLDKATGVPLRVAAYADPEKLRDNIPNWIWEAKTLDKVGKRHIPFSSTLTYYRSFKTDKGELVNKLDIFQSIQVVKVEYDLELPKSTFWPAYQPGIVVIDQIKHTSTSVPGGPAMEKTTVPKIGAPIRVPQSDVSGLLSSAIGIALSVAVLAVAIVLWKRSS